MSLMPQSNICRTCGEMYFEDPHCPKHRVNLDFLRVPPLLQAFQKTQKSITRFIITDSKGEPYLERFVLEKDKTYLHIIYKSDDDREPHSHPWGFTSEILHGSYKDHRFRVANGKLVSWGTGYYSVGDLNKCGIDEYHRLEVISGPVVTLVSREATTSSWGFWVDGEGHVDSEAFLDRKFGKGNWSKEYE